MSSNNKVDVLSPLLVLPPHVCDLVFQHFSGKELLEVSTVAPLFYNFIAESLPSMSKIKVKLGKKSLSGEEKKLLIESGRRYENLEISQFSSHITSAEEILSVPERKWKRITIRCIDFVSYYDCLKFLKIIEPTVQELRMTQVYITSDQRRQHLVNLEFPMLTVLETECCQTLLFREAFVGCTTLRIFTMKAGGDILPLGHEAIKTILRSNRNIEKLGINYAVFNKIFSEDITGLVHFKLKEFHAGSLYRIQSSYPTVKIHFQEFLASQIETIEVLSVEAWMGLETLKTILCMPRLKKLTMKGVHHAESSIEWSDVDLHTNPSIVSLDFEDYANNSNILEKVVRATPSLQLLKVYSLEQKAMEMLSASCKDLKHLEVDFFRPTDLRDEDLFNNIVEIKFKRISKDVTTIGMPTRFTKLIFAAQN